MPGVSKRRRCVTPCEQGLNVHLIGRATKTKIELDQDYIDERLPVGGREMIYRQVENSFNRTRP
jgi:tRNA (uracil-5-)-methyltransferase